MIFSWDLKSTNQLINKRYNWKTCKQTILLTFSSINNYFN